MQKECPRTFMDFFQHLLLRICKLNRFNMAGHSSVLAHTLQQLKHSGCKPNRFSWKLAEIFIFSILLVPDTYISCSFTFKCETKEQKLQFFFRTVRVQERVKKRVSLSEVRFGNFISLVHITLCKEAVHLPF